MNPGAVAGAAFSATAARVASRCGLLQVFVFAGETYLGWDCFERPTVVVGTDPDADLSLADASAAPFRLAVYVEGDRLVVQDLGSSVPVRVNDEPVETAVLTPLDVVSVGSYTLKLRWRPVGGRDAAAEPARPEPASGARFATAAHPLPSPTPVPAADVEPIEVPDVPWVRPARPEVIRLSGSPAAAPAVPVPDAPVGADEQAAAFGRLDAEAVVEVLEELIDLATDTDTAPVLEASVVDAERAPEPPAAAPEPVSPADPDTAAAAQPGPESPRPDPFEAVGEPVESTGAWTLPADGASFEDEEDEEDRPASFSLAELLVEAQPGPDDGDRVLEVLRLRAGQVADARFLGPGEAYRVGRFILAEHRADGTFRVGFDPERHACRVQRPGVPPVDNDTLCTPEHRAGRRRGYRVPLPPDAVASVQWGWDEYRVRARARRTAPSVADPPLADPSWPRSLLTSAMFHAVWLAVLSLFVSLPTPDVPEPETRFVQIDTSQLEALKPEPPPAPKKRPAVRPKKVPAPVTTAKKAPPPKKRPRKTKPPAQKKADVRPMEAALAKSGGKGKGSAAASPKAGGGHGGNALNRNVKNVKKEGILGALGLPNGLPIGASEAVAAVTNLDAVRSPRSGEAALKVGGLVGKLGSSRIEVPKVGLVNTKGSTQAIASAGVGGEGTVAALERGSTGSRKVMAMVKADIKAPVSVQGGMSREEVKRVIDAHMDEISYCYETALIEDPALMGKSTFEWRILESGRVGEVRIRTSSVRSDTLHGCISRAIRSWQFPRPRGAEVLVSYPFVFDVVGF